MKRCFLFVICVLIIDNIFAQAPDWVHTQKPKEGNSSYFYQVISIDNATSRVEALQKATKLARWAGICHKRGWIYESTLDRAEFDNKEYIAVEKKCEYTEDVYGKTVYYFLFQISANDLPKFDYCDCNSREVQSALLNQEKSLHKRAIKNIKTRAIPASVFMPGVGQMVKGQYLKGGLMLGGEVIGIGGIILSYSQKASYERLIKQYPKHAIDYAEYADTWQNVGYGFIGLAAAVYVYSLIDVIVARPSDSAINKVMESLTFAPMYSPKEGSFGLAINLKF